MKDINLLFDQSRRLSDINRFNTLPRIHSESVAEHCYYTTFYVMTLADEIIKQNPEIKLNKEKAMSLAIIHDIEETISSDFPHSTKLKYPEFNDHLEQMNRSIVSNIFNGDQKYIELWNEVRGLDTEEARLVNFADGLSVLFYSKDEVSLGNRFMQHVYSLRKIALEEFIKLYPIYAIFSSLLNS
jgi:5'-deoxynucleotidase YfbR-like HD superfamily hydrolase